MLTAVLGCVVYIFWLLISSTSTERIYWSPLFKSACWSALNLTVKLIFNLSVAGVPAVTSKSSIAVEETVAAFLLVKSESTTKYSTKDFELLISVSSGSYEKLTTTLWLKSKSIPVGLFTIISTFVSFKTSKEGTEAAAVFV